MNNAKKLEENYRMGKTREISSRTFKTPREYFMRDGHNKGQKQYDLTEAEDIKKMWQEYTEELYKKHLNYPDNYSGVIIHLEPDILECEVKWAIESITTNN